jgi:hypothetical protein
MARLSSVVAGFGFLVPGFLLVVKLHAEPLLQIRQRLLRRGIVIEERFAIQDDPPPGVLVPDTASSHWASMSASFCSLRVFW